MWRALAASRACTLVCCFTLKYNNYSDLHPFPENYICSYRNLGLKSVAAFRSKIFSSFCSKFLSVFRSTVRSIFGTRFGGHSGHEISIPNGSRMRAREDIEEPCGQQSMFKCSGCRHLLTQEHPEFP